MSDIDSEIEFNTIRGNRPNAVERERPSVDDLTNEVHQVEESGTDDEVANADRRDDTEESDREVRNRGRSAVRPREVQHRAIRDNRRTRSPTDVTRPHMNNSNDDDTALSDVDYDEL